VLRRSCGAWLTAGQVLAAYEKDGVEMMLRVFNEPGYLEALTGLDKLYDEGEAALEDVDWDEEEDE
jgi:ubiquitin-like modifier-activating enzyme ATG7